MKIKSQIDNRICAYIRGSTNDQINTLDAQEDQFRHYCAFKCLEPTRSIIDQGTSASSIPFLKRPMGREIIDYMTTSGVRQIAFMKLDRAFRDTIDCLNVINWLNDHGYETHILDLNVDTRTPEGEMFITQAAAFARFETRRRSQRQKEAFAAMKKRLKCTGQVSFGWDKVLAADGRISKFSGKPSFDIIPNLPEQEILIWILQMRLEQGLTFAAIANELNLRTIPSKNAGEVRGGKVCSGAWHPSTAQKVIDNAYLVDPEQQEYFSQLKQDL